MKQTKINPNIVLAILAALFIIIFFAPFGLIPFDVIPVPRLANALKESFLMLGEYARDHVLLCLVPAFFIAGAISVFLNRQAIIRYLGPKAHPVVAYTMASISGAILAVCSCTVLPIFKGIYKKGAGLGPAVAFLYSGPAINVLAIVLTAKVLGWEMGLARGLGAVFFSIIIGLLMQLFFRKEDEERVTNNAMFSYTADSDERSLGKTALTMFAMIGILVFLNWAPSKGTSAVWDFIYTYKYVISGVFAAILAFSLIRWYKKDELKEWTISTRDFANQILPLLFIGVLVAGFLLGRPSHEGIIPNTWISGLVGGNSLGANFFASISGAFMYFATLTEIPILQGLMGAGMGKGPALALLLAGPSLSLPSMLVIGKELGVKKTVVYVILVVVLSTLAGWGFGAIA